MDLFYILLIFFQDRLLVDRSTLAHLIYGVLLVSGFTRGTQAKYQWRQGSWAGVEGRRRRPPPVAAEVEASPTTTTTTSRRLKWTSAVATEVDQHGGNGRQNVGEVDRRDSGRATELFLVGGRRSSSSWAVGRAPSWVGGGAPPPGRACRRRKT